ncbi:MAG: lysylphosphatidylglycerol synthase transmembrane domain-containing protein, partial [Myxococcota bacterium]
MRAAILFSLNLALGLLLLGFVLWRYGQSALHLLAADPSPLLLLAFLTTTAITIACLSWRWGYLIAGLGHSLSLVKLALFRSGAHTLAVLIPSGKLGGDPLRVLWATQSGVPVGPGVASVTVDRTQEIGSTAPFSLMFAALLLQADVPYIERALITVVVGTLGLGVGVFFAMRRLRRGAGLVSALVRVTRMDQLAFVKSQFEVIEASERSTLELAEQTQRMIVAFLAGLVSNLLVVAEFALLLWAFDLPSNTTAIAAALFATGAAHLLPVPAGVGVLEGAQIWIFGILGYSADVGLAVGLAVRLRELVWMLPGIIYMLGRALMRP